MKQSGSCFASSFESSAESHFENLPVSKGSTASKYAVFWQQKLFIFASILWMLPFATLSLKELSPAVWRQAAFFTEPWPTAMPQSRERWIPLLSLATHPGICPFTASCWYQCAVLVQRMQLYRKDRISFKIENDTWCLLFHVLEKHQLHLHQRLVKINHTRTGLIYFSSDTETLQEKLGGIIRECWFYAM